MEPSTFPHGSMLTRSYTSEGSNHVENVVIRAVSTSSANNVSSMNHDLPGTSNQNQKGDILSKSKLTPTAKEFWPSGSNPSSHKNTGAVRKKQYYRQHETQNNNLQTSRVNDSHYERNYKKNYDYNRNKEEQNKTLKEAAEFLQKIKETPNCDNKSSSNNDNACLNNSKTKETIKQNSSSREGKNNFNYNKFNTRHKNYYFNKNYKYENENDKNVGKRNKNYNSNNKNKENDNFKNWRKNDANIKTKLDAGSQRERLEQMIKRNLLECLVCCEKVRSSDKVWNCKQCYHILHFECIVRWAKSSKLENGWRCPACQNVYTEVPNEYVCYCGKVKDPHYGAGTLPHSCGEICYRISRNCKHKCSLFCHPGPCPDCNIMISRACGCGKTNATVMCSSTVEIKCQEVCNKLLNCKQHYCKAKCHGGSCSPCEEKVEQECFCGRVNRSVCCTLEIKDSKYFECNNVCDKLLSCGNHNCQQTCHSGPCEPCALSVNRIYSCPCGQTPLKYERKLCLDPISCCDKICQKILKCGQPGNYHTCKKPCHHGPCPSCPLTTLVRCRCGHMDKEIPCKELTTKADDALCEKKCNKKRLCGKHRCKELCCIEQDHICPLPCNRQLSCGLHRCSLTCHSGRCPACLETSFEELHCECGGSVYYPPIPCGTRPPPCDKPCSRARPCGHEINHSCHTGPCPPCTVLSKRWCYGRHEQRATIPCYLEDFSCGLACRKNMDCGRHTCIQACHLGPCPVPCSQPCTEIRTTCGHPCNAPCHESPCPETPCKQIVRVSCQCGLRSSTRPCMDLTGEYHSIAMAQLASKMSEIQKGNTVDISDIICNQRKSGVLKTLECNDECRIVERNRRLAIGLQIRNPDLSAKLTPRYSDYMRAWAKKDGRFCQNIHDKLTELVQLAKQSKQKSRAYSFDSMNREKRHFIHEYCEHFGCDSEAYDQEPNRNVVATAHRDKSWLPSVSLLELIQRENGQRKVPGPVLSKSGSSKSESVSLRLPGRIPRPPTPPGEYIDYFNGPPV